MEKMMEMLQKMAESNWEEFDKLYKELAGMADFFGGRDRLDEKVQALINAYCACASAEQFNRMVEWFWNHDAKLSEALGLKLR